jgi:hypothetical protein
MNAEIVNLRMARKRAGRVEKERQADANRALHSVSAIQRKAARAREELEQRRVDGHRLADPKSGETQDGGTDPAR